MEMLQLNDLHKTFNPGTVNEKVALNGVSLHMEAGDFATIVGSNGAGKSTLFNAIAGSFYVDAGAITVGGLIPADAVFKVEVTNNGKDSSPVWEDATTEARNGRNHLFTNQTAANGFAFNFRVTAERGASGESGYIASIQGGFQ